MNHKSSTAIRASLRRAVAGTTWLILMSAAGTFFAVGFVLGVTRVVLGLHEEHRKFADLVKLATDKLRYMRIAAGRPGSANVSREGIA